MIIISTQGVKVYLFEKTSPKVKTSMITIAVYFSGCHTPFSISERKVNLYLCEIKYFKSQKIIFLITLIHEFITLFFVNILNR